MKRYIWWCTFFYVAFNATLCEAFTKHYFSRLKYQLDYEVKELRKCIKRDPHCDLKRRNLYTTLGITAGIIMAALVGVQVKKRFFRANIIPEKKPDFVVPVSNGKPAWLQKEEERREQERIAEENKKIAEKQQQVIEPLPSDIEESLIDVASDYSSASDGESSDEGYESADDGEVTKEQLRKSIATYEATYQRLSDLLTTARLRPHLGELPQEYNKDKEAIKTRQNAAEVYYRQTLEEKDPQQKLDLLKEALNKLRGR